MPVGLPFRQFTSPIYRSLKMAFEWQVGKLGLNHPIRQNLSIFAQQYAKLPHHQIAMSEAGKHFLMWDDTAWFFNQTDAFLKENSVAKK